MGSFILGSKTNLYLFNKVTIKIINWHANFNIKQKPAEGNAFMLADILIPCFQNSVGVSF